MDPFSRRRVLGKTAYAVTYAVAGTAAVTAVVGVASFALGAGLSGVKVGQFVVGWLLFGWAALGLRPKAAWKRDWEAEETASERIERATETEEDADDREKAEESARMLDPFSDRRPRRSGNREDDLGTEGEWSFRDVVGRLPPASLVSLTATDRPREAVCHGLTAVCVLGVSFALEAVLGV